MKTYAPAKPLPSDTVPDRVLETDVVIIGSGGGGSWAAVQCARKGVRVTVLEKGANYACSNTSQIGGTTFCNTRTQKEAGIHIDQMALFKHMMQYAEGTVNARIVRRYLEESGEMMDYWLDLGCQVIIGADRYESGFDTVHMFMTRNKMELLQKDAEKNGAVFLYRTTGRSIVMEDGRAVGVLAEDAEGNILRVNAACVVIATGGFLGNPEMVKEHFGASSAIACAGMPTCTGDGIRMALEAGAVLDTNFALSTLSDMSGYNAKYSKIASFTNYFTPRFQAFVFGNTGTMLVDNQGKRFVNEYLLSTNPLAYGSAVQTRVGRYYAIVDQALVDYYMTHTPFDRVGRDPKVWNVGPILFDRVQDRLDADIAIAIEEGWAWKADSVEALAGQLDMEGLVKTVSDYNAAYDAGYDPELDCPAVFMAPLRQGPFYAIEYQCGALVTMGGIKTDDICRALNADNRPVPGLYVVSSDNGSAFSSPYYDIGGTSSGLAMATGWIAGEEIAKAFGKV